MPADAQADRDVKASAEPEATDACTPDIASMTRAMAHGDEGAFRDFHAAYAGRLARYLFVVSRGDEQSIRDALQETFRRVVRHIRHFKDEQSFWSWLTVLARSAHADGRRSTRRYLGFLDRFRLHMLTRDSSSGADEEARLKQALEQCLQMLADDERDLLETKYFENLGVAEIAVNKGCSTKAIESRLTRARERLRKLILEKLTHET